jgi:hypothetical protein
MRKIDKPSWFWFAVLLFLIPLVWWHLFFRDQIPVDGNVLRVLYPNRTFLLAHPPSPTHWPLWNPYRNMGEPFLADPITMAAYPPTWILSHVASMLTFFRLWVIGHTILAGGFMGLWVYKHTRDPSATIGAALVAMFNGFFTSRITLAHHFASAAYLPMVLYYFDEERFVPLAVALALQWLAGFPSFSYVTVLLLVTWSALEHKSKPALLCRSGLVAVALAAYQVIPFLEYLYHSVRSFVLDPPMALNYSEPWRQLVKIILVPQWFAWHPQLVGDQAVVSFYTGPFALFLALWAAWKGGRRERTVSAIVVASLFLSLGEHLPGYSHIALFRVMRFPANWLLIAATGMAFLCGLGLASMRQEKWKWVFMTCIAIDLVGFGQYVRVPWFETSYLSNPPSLATLLRPLAETSRLYHSPSVTEGLAVQQLNDMQDYLFIKEALTPSYGMAFGFREVSSYDTLELKRAAQFQANLAAQGPGSPLLKWAGVSTVITRKSGTDPWGPQNIRIISLTAYDPPVFFAKGSTSSRIVLSIHEPGKTVATVVTNHADRLVFSEIAYSGWRVTVDNRPADLSVFEDAFLAVNLVPGQHKVIFDYRPLAFWIGLLVSLGAILVIGVKSVCANNRSD